MKKHPSELEEAHEAAMVQKEDLNITPILAASFCQSITYRILDDAEAVDPEVSEAKRTGDGNGVLVSLR